MKSLHKIVSLEPSALPSLTNALSELGIPHFLTASIFSAQSGKNMVFYRNAKIVLSLCLLSGICSGLRSCCFGLANMILVKRMRETLYSTLLFQDMTLFDEETVGDLTNRLSSDCQQVSRVIGNDLNVICRNVVQGIGALIALFMISWPLAISTVVICACLAIMLFFYGRFQKWVAKLIQDFGARANEVSQETFSLIRTVRIYGTEKQEIERYRTWLERLWDISLRQSVGYGFWSLTYNCFYHSTKIVAVLIGGVSILRGDLTAELLTKFLAYAEWLIFSAWSIGDNWSSLMQSIGASEKVFQLMDLLPRKKLISGGRQLQELTGHIEFVNVSFHYPSRWKFPAVERIHLSIQPNKVLAIVGRSGSGKSTIANLLLRLYEPTNGAILVDGIPIEDLDIRWLRGRIGFVSQEPPLFRMDVTSNIRYGCTRETTQEEVEWAAKQAFAHEFILSLPNGYSTLVDNALLSGGQKQRIAIARAILRDPTILILDEATSALDAESEHYVKELLLSDRNASGERRTVVIIAHRLSTIQAADTIVVMDSGRVVEVGSHKELMLKDGLYATLVRRQTDAID
ncbi:ABC transporter B family member 26, chloroplastic [Phalaenopsis equestris]|uniref:ABC transporter B family member 26, chloroplastic n=1 Tax=Phalaenopsis equestris TaxID=78828 RepID=UPI0009E2D758|nr:ABC transporter B family member 26, chloroplastic [Phalaenopsis equestris]